ncbi:hypothetical protein Pst134EA_000313 [Puccinia striiformis f. sp. tritici]|uniref:hypothetical protein n=1 Tax=Puccinia striiformis f. sp. tritici TaxID=168172 RepID=UPI0020076D92|nr:hypothetical protein Pst134EA_000313 [Puccinia striiformis f. sp. tritici]KAH9473239.1 hypothetical protein Pst134EA_000313 [Puccinia striiformis f. sp. tritici]
MAELDPTITGLESAVEELRRERDLQIKQLGNLVVEGFRSLARKHNLPHEPIGRHEATDPISTQESPSPSEVDSKKQLLIRLHSTLLPSLLSQFTSLHQAFSPMIIWRDTPTQLRITGETLIQIDHTLDEITSVVDSICPTRPPTPNQTDDHDLYELKNYRLHGLDHWIKGQLWGNLGHFIFHSGVHLMETGLSTLEPEPDRGARPSGWGRVWGCIIPCQDSIEMSMNWLKGSEWDSILINWRSSRDAINHLLERHVDRIHGRPSFFSGGPALSEPKKLLGQSFITIIKLTRLFFNKMSTRGINHKPLPLFTNMCSNDLRILSNLGDGLRWNIETIISIVIGPLPPDQFLINQCIRVIDIISAQFQSSAILILSYILPLIPVSSYSFPVHDYFRDWFFNWQTQIQLATQNCIQVAHSLLDQPV